MNDIEQVINDWIMTHTDTAMAMAYLFFVLMIIAIVLMTWFITHMIYKIYTYKKEKNKKGGWQI